MEEKKKLSRKDKTILKLIIDELHHRDAISAGTSTNSNAPTISEAVTSDGADGLYENIFDKLSRDNDGDTRYNDETKELTIFFAGKWHKAKIDTIIETIRKKNMSIYEVLEEMIEENIENVA